MLQLVKGRTLEVGQVVQVYFNLHKKCYSIRDKKTGLVVAHASTVSVHSARLVVSQAGRERVLREKKKNVHAVVEGAFMSAGDVLQAGVIGTLHYNPYKVSQFVDRHTLEEVHTAKFVHCQDKQAFYLKG